MAVISDLLGEKITFALKTVSTQVWRVATNFKRRVRTVTSSGSWMRRTKKKHVARNKWTVPNALLK